MYLREVAEQSDVVFVIVGYPKDVEQVILDEDEGIVPVCSEIIHANIL